MYWQSLRNVIEYKKGGDIMAQSKAHIRATNKYISKAYDRVNLTLPKGYKEEVRTHAEQQGLSLNAYINKLISEDMKKTNGPAGTPWPSQST